VFRLIGAFLGRIRYRRRWGQLAAAAEAAADKATADLNRRKGGRRARRGKGSRVRQMPERTPE
jgi:hypothetical protein